MAKRIFFRVDGSTQMGVGHLKRCLSLAHALVQHGADVHFVTRDHGLGLSEIMGVFADQTHILPSGGTVVAEDYSTWMGVTMQQDAAETLECIGQMSCDWVIVDHYGIDADWHSAVQSKAECKIAVIDDLANRQISADLIIDQNWHEDHSKKYAGVNINGAPILGGPKYAMLGKEYSTRDKYQFKKDVASIGVFMGGADHMNCSLTVLRSLENIGFSGTIEIVTTRANKNIAKLNEAVNARPFTHLTTNLPNLAKFFTRHDLQIGAGSGATWERFNRGAPSLLLSFTSNHDEVLAPLQRINITSTLLSGWDCKDLERSLREIIADSALRLECSKKGVELVDGNGTSRLLTALEARG